MIGKKDCSLISSLDDPKVLHFCFHSTYEENIAYQIMRLLYKLKKSPPSVHVIEKNVTLMPCDLTKTIPVIIDFDCNKKSSSCNDHFIWD